MYSVMGFGPNQITCIAHIIVLHMLTCTVHICLLYKGTDLYSFMIKYNIIHSVFLIAHIIKIIEAERKIAMELGFEKR